MTFQNQNPNQLSFFDAIKSPKAQPLLIMLTVFFAFSFIIPKYLKTYSKKNDKINSHKIPLDQPYLWQKIISYVGKEFIGITGFIAGQIIPSKELGIALIGLSLVTLMLDYPKEEKIYP